MKKLLIFVLFAGIVLAQTNCQEYVDIAETRLAPPYPNYFGAAGEYVHAADCYYSIGQSSLADTYYVKSAEHYIIAAGELVTGGDNFQRAKSLELAASSYGKVGDTAKALQYYSEAREIYETYGYSSEASQMTLKINSLTSTSVQESFDVVNIIGFISLLALFFSLFAIVYLLTQKQQYKSDLGKLQRKVRKDEKKIEEIKVRRREEFVAPPRRTEHEPKERKLTPKEKMAQKLREKYMPK